eukprot:12907227-Prorocentrum_lima.AAC.1
MARRGSVGLASRMKRGGCCNERTAFPNRSFDGTRELRGLLQWLIATYKHQHQNHHQQHQQHQQ